MTRLLHELIESRMRGKPTRGRIQTLHDLANDNGGVALKQAAGTEEDRDTEDVKNLLYSRRLLMIAVVTHSVMLAL